MSASAVFYLILFLVLVVVLVKYFSVSTPPEPYSSTNNKAIRLFNEYHKLIRYWLTHFKDPGFINWAMKNPLPGGPVTNFLTLERLKNPSPSDPEFLDFLISNKGFHEDEAKRIVSSITDGQIGE